MASFFRKISLLKHQKYLNRFIFFNFIVGGFIYNERKNFIHNSVIQEESEESKELKRLFEIKKRESKIKNYENQIKNENEDEELETKLTEKDEDNSSESEEDDGEEDRENNNNISVYNEETREINWDCPCLGNMPHGTCGKEFKEAFSCFLYSEHEPKGKDCISQFEKMRNCFKSHPAEYEKDLYDEEHNGEFEKNATSGDSITGTQVVNSEINLDTKNNNFKDQDLGLDQEIKNDNDNKISSDFT